MQNPTGRFTALLSVFAVGAFVFVTGCPGLMKDLDDLDGPQDDADAGADADAGVDADAGADADAEPDDTGDVACVGESDAEFCQNIEIECGTAFGEDRCGQDRVVDDCGQFDDLGCAPDDVCDDGVCRAGCGDGLQSCDDQCVDVMSDVNHCGDCNHQCDTDITGAQASCREGVCVDECETDGFTVCDDECVDPEECGGWDVRHQFENLELPQVGTISRDGSRVAYQEQMVGAGVHDRIHVRDVDSGELIVEFEAEMEHVGGMALGPDGEYLAVNAYETDDPSTIGLYLYLISDDMTLLTDWVTGNTPPWFSPAFEPGGQRLSVAMDSGTVQTRSVPDVTEDPFGGNWMGAPSSRDIAYSEGHRIVTNTGSGSQDDGPVVHSYEDVDYVKEHRFSEGTAFGVAIADDDSFLAYDAGFGDIQVHEVGGSWEPFDVDINVTTEVEAMAASGNGAFLAVEDPGLGTIEIFETGEGQWLESLDGAPSYQQSGGNGADGLPIAAAQIEFCADGEFLVVPSAEEGVVYVYEYLGP